MMNARRPSKEVKDPKPPTAKVVWKFDRLGAAAWAFEIFEAVLSVVDVASDVLVAVQFYFAGHLAWFWMVALSLLVSNTVYALFAVRMIVRDVLKWRADHAYSKKEFFMAFAWAFPFAQAFPLAVWFAALRKKHGDEGLRGIWRGLWLAYTPDGRPAHVQVKKSAAGSAASQLHFEPNDGDGDDEEEEEVVMKRDDSWSAGADDAATQQTLAEEAEQRALAKRLMASAQAHVQANVGFYMETVAESIPQALIQLLAMSALGDATPLQLLSMSVSLFSIVSKSYVLALSFDLRAMLFKASLVAFDVFALFYVFATVAAHNEPRESTVFMLLPRMLGVAAEDPRTTAAAIPLLDWVAFETSALSAAWLTVIGVLGVALVVTALSMLSVIAFEELVVQRRGRYFAFAVALIWIAVGFTPVFVAVLSAKLTLVLLALLKALPPRNKLPFYAVSFSFVWGGWRRGPVEGAARTRHILRYIIDETERRSLNAANRRRSGTTLSVARGPLSAMASVLREHVATRFSGRAILTYSRPKIEGVSTGKTLYQHLFGSQSQNNNSRVKRAIDIVCAATMATTALLFVAYAVFSVAFPFLHVAMYGLAQENLLQLCCLGGMAACLALLATYARFMQRFVSFCYFGLEYDAALRAAGNTGTTLEVTPHSAFDATTAIRGYHQPPHVVVLKQAIRPRVLPHDMCDDMAAFLAPGDIDMRGLSVDQCAALRDAAACSR